jgi:type II secretory pathway pseudopilin PulG
MYCSKCGIQNADEASFCSKCGAPLSLPAPASPPTNDVTVYPAKARASSASSNQAFDEEAWRAAVGPTNAEYYLPRMRTQHSVGTRSMWHWPAFFVTFYWLLYRKQWLSALAYLFLPYVTAVILAIALEVSGSKESVLAGIFWLSYLAIVFIGPPLVANSLYYSHCKALINRHSATARSREHFLAVLETKGGTSNVATIVIAFLAFITIIGNLAAVSLPAYQDYTKRAKSSEAVLVGMSVAKLVGEYYERTGQIPENLDQFLTTTQSSKFITAMTINSSNGVIEMKVSFGPNSIEGTIYLVPGKTQGGTIAWTCKAEPAMTRYVPQSCREK